MGLAMSRRSKREREDLQRLAAAAAWRVALWEAGQASSAGFEAWMSEDRANALAWDQVQGPWTQIGAHATSPETMALREQALQRARREQRRRLATLSWPSERLAASIAAAVLIAAVGAGHWAGAPPDVYRTSFGERRTITLADGSRVTLDSGSLLKVRLGRDVRRLQLIRGQARFDVAHDQARPFSVQARDQLVIATGTNFNVELLGPKVLVTLIEGKVTVMKAPPAPPIPLAPQPPRAVLARLSAGQQFVAAPSGSGEPVQAVTRVAAANLDRAIAWESGQLVFDDEPLGAVAERVSRYSAKPIVVEGPAADLRISGVFNTGDVSTFVEAVQRGLPVRAQRTDKDVVLKMANP